MMKQLFGGNIIAKTAFIFVFLNILIMDFLGFLKERRAQGEWSSIYLLIIFAIAALVMIALIKPMFKQSMKVAKSTTVS